MVLTMQEALPGAGLQRDLIPVNAVIGFLKRDRRWPAALYNLGYQLSMIDQLVTSSSAGNAEVDVICVKHREDHAILWECKSGKTLSEKQARVYAALTAEDVQRTGNVTFHQPSRASIEPVYCCLEADETTVVSTLSTWEVTIPVIGLGETAHLAAGRLADPEVHAAFAAGLRLPALEEVPRFLIANAHTPKERIAPALFATMVSFLRGQRGKFSVRHLLQETFPDWECMGTDLRRHLSSTANDIVTELCKNELSDMARVAKATHSPGAVLIEFTVNVLGLDASARTRTFQKLARLAEGYTKRVKENRPYEPGQEPESMWLPGLGPESD